MKKLLLTCFLGAVVLQADMITKELAEKQGEGFAVVANMNPTVDTYEGRLELCEELVNSGGILSADNRKEMLPYVINSCKEKVKKQ